MIIGGKRETEAALRKRLSGTLDWPVIPDAAWAVAFDQEFVTEALAADFGEKDAALLEVIRKNARKKPGGRRRPHAGHPNLIYCYTKAMRERLIAEGRLVIEIIGTPADFATVEYIEGPDPITAGYSDDEIVIWAEPWVPVETIRRAYLAAQSWQKGDDSPNRPLGAASIVRYRWVTQRREQHPHETWRAMMLAWNEDHAPTEDNWRNFRRDYLRAEEKLSP